MSSHCLAFLTSCAGAGGLFQETQCVLFQPVVVNKDGESVKEQDLPSLPHGKRHDAVEHRAVVETGSKGNAHLLSRQAHRMEVSSTSEQVCP